MGLFAVAFAPRAEADLLRLFDFLLDRAKTVEDLLAAQRNIEALRHAIERQLAVTPFSFRKSGVGRRSTRRELVISQGHTGYVAQFEISGPAQVLVVAVRHQREDDYH